MTDETIVVEDDDVVAVDDAEPAEAEAEDSDVEEMEVLEADAETDESDDDDEEADEIEFNFNGEKMRVPKNAIPEELATRVDQFVRTAEAETTRKMQAIADRAKSIEARESAADKLIGLQGEALETYSRGLAIRQELTQLQQIDLPALWQSNPDEARRVSDRIAQRQAEFQQTVTSVSQAEQAMLHESAEETKRRNEEGRADLAKRVKDFDKVKDDVFEYVERTSPLSRDVIEQQYAVNPHVTEWAWKAMQYDRLQAGAKAKAKAQPNAPVAPVKPQVKGGRARRSYDLVTDADKMSADEWMKRRNQQLAKR